jgi:hypothetical protein
VIMPPEGWTDDIDGDDEDTNFPDQIPDDE